MEFPNLISPVYEFKQRQYVNRPCHTNRASALGGDCERALVYSRLNWAESAPPPVDLLVIFMEGDKHEEGVLADLRKAGVTVIEQQASLGWPEYQITGHIDAVVLADGQAIPIDVKSMSPHIWDATFRRGAGVYQWEEVREAFQAKPWLRKYRGQITLYMLMKCVERGVLLCINKATGALAQANLELDYAYGEWLIQRAERLNKHVAAKTYPDRIPFDEDVCPKCPFFHICLPDCVGGDPIAFLEDATVEKLLEDREVYSEAASAYDAADRRFKSWAKARAETKLTIGEWLIEKRQQKNGVRVEARRL